MAARFIIGRAGTGKTHHCVEAIRTELRHDPVDGPKLIFLVPEQAGLQMERTILDAADVPGAHRIEVTSFQRLAFKVLQTTHQPERSVLSEPARAMVLQHIATQHRSQLKYYRRLDRQIGSVERLAKTITELIQEAIEPQDLLLNPSDSIDEMHSAKLHDLAVIFRAYLDYLGDRRVDPSQHIELATARIADCDSLANARLWVDGFASMSGQETLMLIELAKRSASLEMTVLMDPRIVSKKAPQSVAAMFRKTVQTHSELERRFADAGVSIEPPRLLEPACPPRFTRETAIARLEQWLFEPSPPPKETPDISALTVTEAPSRRLEAQHAVATISQWVRESAGALRYRDVALIVRDLEPYHDLLGSLLTAANIPFFIDRRRSIAHHPLVELLRSAVAMAADDMSIESVQLALKTGLTPVVDEDELENYLLARGITGLAAWQSADWTGAMKSTLSAKPSNQDKPFAALLARVNKSRRTLLEPFADWLKFARHNKEKNGAAWAAALDTLLTRLNVFASLERWRDEADDNGDADQAAEHEQVWRDVTSFLEDLGSAFADHTLSVNQLARTLETGLANITLGLAPPMIDQLLVSSIERSRHPSIKAAVVLGFNDGVFPKPHREDSILTDDDRNLLRKRDIRVGPPTRDLIIDESMLVYIALSRASDRLMISYALNDDNGKPLQESPFLPLVRAACPGLKVTTINDPVSSRTMWDILTLRDLSRRVVLEFRHRPPPDDTDARSRWNELYSVARNQLVKDPAARRALSSVVDPPPAKLSPQQVASWAGGTLRASVSQLEAYATCPFKYFGRSMLYLQTRGEAEMGANDIGSVHHAVLDEFVENLLSNRRSLTQLTEDDIVASLDGACQRISGRIQREMWPRARDAYLLKRSRNQLARVMRAQRAAAACIGSHPKKTELPFGFDKPTSLPVLRLTTPHKRDVVLRGFIDRVDVAELGDELLGIVIDYKRAADQKLDMSKVYHGLSLQLLGYLLALSEHGTTLAGRPIEPIAALYVSLTPRYTIVNHPDDLSERDKALSGTGRPHGLLMAERFDSLIPEDESGWVDHFNCRRLKSGGLAQGDTASQAQFASLLAHTRNKLGELADGILDGDIAVRPYRLGTHSPCGWCDFTHLCRFEIGVSDVRYLPSFRRNDALDRICAAAGSDKETPI